MILLELAIPVAVFLIAVAMFVAIVIQAIGWQLHREHRIENDAAGTEPQAEKGN